MKKIRPVLLVLSVLYTLPLLGQTAQTSANQRAQVHSKEVHGATTPGQIPYLLVHSSGDVHLSFGRTAGRIMPPDATGVIAELTCGTESDLIVLGKLGKGISSPTVDQGYIYTDWDLTVEQVFRNAATTSVQPGETIVVTRPGGELTINRRHVYAIEDDFPRFHAGEEVVLYLRSLPSVGTYAISAPNGFYLSKSNVIPFYKGYAHLFIGVQRDDFLQLVQAAPICIASLRED